MTVDDLVFEPLSGALGVEVANVDLEAEASSDDHGNSLASSRLSRALVDHQVLVFRGLRLDPGHLMAVARLFGSPTEYPFLEGVKGFPEVVEVKKRRHETVNFGGIWHSDTSYLERPPKATVLYAVEVPPQGGDTLFANTRAAYESLSPGMRRLLDPLRALNIAGKKVTSATRSARIEERGKAADEVAQQAWHPVVRTHPESGERSLYVNPAHTVRFEDMTELESRPLLEFLWSHQTEPEFTCRVRWRQGTLVVWDNRSTVHYPINDYHGHRRLMHRISLAGDQPL